MTLDIVNEGYLAVSEYYDRQRESARRSLRSDLRSLYESADTAAQICEDTHVNGGDAENDTDEPEMENNTGINVVGGTQSSGTRGRVTVSPVN